MTEQMRRELRIATHVARAQGYDYGTMPEEKKAACHKLARVVMPAVNSLLSDERINTQSEMHKAIKDTHMTASRKAYDEGFEDGQVNSYKNRWQTEESPWKTDTLLG